MEEIVELAKDLVALWESPNIRGLARADRNAAIEETRNRLINSVHKLGNSDGLRELPDANSDRDR